MKKHRLFISFQDRTIISLFSTCLAFLYQAIVTVFKFTFKFPLPWMVNRRPWGKLSKVNIVEFNFTVAPIDNFMETVL